MTQLQRTAIVVGVGSEQGLGAALSRRFAREGYNVVVSGRTEAKLARVVRSIIDNGGKAEAVVADATIEADVVALFDQAETGSTDSLDLVVFNAGNNARHDFRTMPAQFFEQTWRVATFGGFLVGREAAVVWRRVGGGRSFSPVPPRVCADVLRLPHSHRPRRDCGRWRNRWRGNSGRSEFTSAMLSSMAVSTANN
jgi:NAD(P)-dependent dehydrogenase (short-subunit alcohol dehydrogenase family)